MSVTSKEFFEIMVTEMLSTYRVLQLQPNTLEAPITVGSEPKRLRVYFMEKDENKSGLQKGWLDIEYYKNIPIGVRYYREPSAYHLPYAITQKLQDMFSEEDWRLIRPLNFRQRAKVRMASKQYQEIINKQKSYPASYNMKNCLAAGSITEERSYSYTKLVQIAVNRDVEQIVTEYYDHVIKVLTNVSNHPILIPGFFVQHIYGQEEINYMDDSKILQPGESIDEITISPEFNDNLHWNQYVGDVGIIKKSKSEEASNTTENDSEPIPQKVFAKRINSNKLEIDSYTNITDINIKKGDKINIVASGSVTYGAWAGSGGPDGIDGYTSYNRISGFRHGSLLVRIGDNGEWEAVGASKLIIAKNSGVLQFIVNEKTLLIIAGLLRLTCE
jgi:hypothetical protein